jgi:hypothetical protein
MSDQHHDNEQTLAVLGEWKVKELQVSGDVPPPSEAFDRWLSRLRRNDRRAPKLFIYEGATYSIRSYWTTSAGDVLHVRLERAK